MSGQQYNGWSPDPVQQFLHGQAENYARFAEQAKPNKVLHEMNFSKADSRPAGDYFDRPDWQEVNAPVGLISVDGSSTKKCKKKKDAKADDVSFAAKFFWVFFILCVIGFLIS